MDGYWCDWAHAQSQHFQRALSLESPRPETSTSVPRILVVERGRVLLDKISPGLSCKLLHQSTDQCSLWKFAAIDCGQDWCSSNSPAWDLINHSTLPQCNQSRWQRSQAKRLSIGPLFRWRPSFEFANPSLRGRSGWCKSRQSTVFPPSDPMQLGSSIEIVRELILILISAKRSWQIILWIFVQGDMLQLVW